MARTRSLAVCAVPFVLWVVACRGPAAGGDGVPAWPDTLPDAAAFAPPPGMTAARAIVHVHSVYSHDACDGAPQDEAGRLNEECLERLRRALCAANVDAAFLTEHDRHLVRADSLAEALLLRSGDTRLFVKGRLAANRIRCPGGRGNDPILFAGAENSLMVVGLDSLPGGTHEERRAFYETDTAGAADLFRRYGAVVLLSHPEDVSPARIARLAPDGIEVYNPHANFAPKHRAAQGLSRLGAFWDILPFYGRWTSAHPDLALLPLFRANRPAIDRWDGLLARRTVFGFGASDAHENSLPWALADGERGDAYARLIPWVTNVLLIGERAPRAAAPPGSGRVSYGPEAVEEALRQGRFYVAIEAWGTPAGFDFRLEAGEGSSREVLAEMGATIAREALLETSGARLVVTPPTVAGRGDRLPQPAVRTRLYRIAASGERMVVAESFGPIEVPLAQPGAYRVEVGIVPRHLTPYLGGDADRYLREVVWIYSNPIRIL
ncbi:MAG TPA: hypothetical protein VM737_05175 [Gemmatimonadota bacterium]|nr:hypothetical protein [Gemmatimonadota bacterium]